VEKLEFEISMEIYVLRSPEFSGLQYSGFYKMFVYHICMYVHILTCNLFLLVRWWLLGCVLSRIYGDGWVWWVFRTMSVMLSLTKADYLAHMINSNLGTVESEPPGIRSDFINILIGPSGTQITSTRFSNNKPIVLLWLNLVQLHQLGSYRCTKINFEIFQK